MRVGFGILTALGLLVAGQAHADPIVVSSVAEAGSNIYGPASKLIGGSGFVAGDAGAYSTDFNTMWLSNPGSTLTFNLGAIYNLSDMTVWNYNENEGTNEMLRGVKTMTIETSSDGVSFTALSSPTTLNVAPGNSTTDFSQLVQLPVTAQFIEFTNLASFNGPGTLTGLSQVEFDGTAASIVAQVPEPISLSLLSAGLVSTLLIRRRSV